MSISTDKKKIKELLTRGVIEVIDKKNLEKKLFSGKKLRIKLGIDPTGPRLHLGRSVQLLKLRDFQELGHQIVLIIGDSTGLVGDTSDKSSERPMLDRKTVEANMKTYADQFKLLLETKKIEIRYNSEWLAKLDFLAAAEMADLFSVHEFTARENIKLRLDAGKRVSLRELFYPIMQGYDSVAVRADVEIGGTDQRFNLLAGRTIQPFYKQPPQDILTNRLIDGLDGQKMSTSRGNIIAILDEPNDQFGKIMSMRDELIIPYFETVTREPLTQIKKYQKELAAGTNPRDIKMILARKVVMIYHGEEKAVKAAENFKTLFQDKKLPQDLPVIKIKKSQFNPSWNPPYCSDVLSFLTTAGMAKSKSEAKRLVEQKAVHLDGALITDWQAEVALRNDMVIMVGKRKVGKIKII